MKKRGTPLVSDLATGRIFGRLVVVGEGERRGRARAFWCQCECGQKKLIVAINLLTGNSTSCGCLHREQLSEYSRTHGRSSTPEHKTWEAMRQRCLNPRNPSYPQYGGRGIRICDRWMAFENFYADMGRRPVGTSIDRVDVNGDYEPDNCRWATAVEQMRNTTRTFEAHEPEQIRWLVDSGYTQREIARFFNVDVSTIHRVATMRTYA